MRVFWRNEKIYKWISVAFLISKNEKKNLGGGNAKNYHIMHIISIKEHFKKVSSNFYRKIF